MVSNLLSTYYVPCAVFYVIYEMLKVLLKYVNSGDTDDYWEDSS